MKLYFLDRTVSASKSFPPYGFCEEVEDSNKALAAKGQPFMQREYLFEFDETVSHNGWWAKKGEDYCRVVIE